MFSFGVPRFVICLLLMLTVPGCGIDIPLPSLDPIETGVNSPHPIAVAVDSLPPGSSRTIRVGDVLVLRAEVTGKGTEEATVRWYARDDGPVRLDPSLDCPRECIVAVGRAAGTSFIYATAERPDGLFAVATISLIIRE